MLSVKVLTNYQQIWNHKLICEPRLKNWRNFNSNNRKCNDEFNWIKSYYVTEKGSKRGRVRFTILLTASYFLSNVVEVINVGKVEYSTVVSDRGSARYLFWKKILFLLWPEFLKNPSGFSKQTSRDALSRILVTYFRMDFWYRTPSTGSVWILFLISCLHLRKCCIMLD